MSMKNYKDADSYRKSTSKYKAKRRIRERSQAHSYKYPYTTEEREMIMLHEIPDVEIAKKLGRTTMAIQTARCKWRLGYDNKKNR